MKGAFIMQSAPDWKGIGEVQSEDLQTFLKIVN